MTPAQLKQHLESIALSHGYKAEIRLWEIEDDGDCSVYPPLPRYEHKDRLYSIADVLFDWPKP